MKSGGQTIGLGTHQMLPVFRGLAEAKIQGNELARMIGVAPATVSKWRTGRSRIPAETQVFMTLLLANRIEDIVHDLGPQGRHSRRMGVALRSIVGQLHRQEAINTTLHPAAQRLGARLFRQWWQRGNGPESDPIAAALIYPGQDRLGAAL